MKYLYFISTLILHFFIFRFFGEHELFVVVATLSFSITLIGVMLYRDKEKTKSIKELGWGIMFGSLTFMVILILLSIFIYFVTINSPF